MIAFKQVNFKYAAGLQESGLTDINLIINGGEVVLLCGESGCGKTTLTRLINGLIPNYYDGTLTGEVLVNGKDVSTLPLYETAEMVGSVFQNPRTQFFNVDTTSELAFGAENQGLPVVDIQARMSLATERMKIESLMGRNIFQLSGGEKQKIACASVSVCEPSVIVLDEPTSNLDTRAIEELRQMIQLWKSEGKTVIIAEHRLYFLRDLADRAIYLENGRIARDLSMKELMALSAAERKEMGLRVLSLDQIEATMPSSAQARIEAMELDGFSFCYRQVCSVALFLEHARIPKGGIIAIVGQNGAGKTTLARCLCGLEKKGNGTLIDGACRMDCKKRLKNCYMVMQDVNHQLFTESVLDEVLLSMPQESPEKACQILEELDLLALKEAHPMSLSGGQKQRVAIASAIASEREIMIFDEPTSGLDLNHMTEVSFNLKQLAAKGRTLFVITHDPELILSCCTHFMLLKDGKLLRNEPLDATGIQELLLFFKMENEYSKKQSGIAISIEDFSRSAKDGKLRNR